MDNTTIQKFLDEHDYDIRKTHNGRWIDQKCTMDVVCLVSDCIVEYTSNREDKRFTVNDIWYSDYTVENVQQIFSKPNPTQKASNEYDKYFGQPIKLLDAAGVIHGEKSGRGYTYSIVNQELLEYISFRERNSFNFLCLYIEKVLKDSGLYRIFEYFFRLQDKNSFRELKDAYTQFTINYTPINGATECGRIFTKVLNPLACKYRKCGTERGHISKDIITQDMIMYNQRNWRDILSEKPKDMTRIEYEITLPKPSEDCMTTYRINRAKKNLRRFNDQYRNGKTEVYDERHIKDPATQMHHIFPASDCPIGIILLIICADSLFSKKIITKNKRIDINAVKNGIKLKYNNGLAEGSVNKIKVIKRIMYGRNSFDLLKAKVLLHEHFRCEFN